MFREKVEQEIQRLQKEGTIEPVEVSDWVAPIIPVIKRDKCVRICGDFRLTVNAVCWIIILFLKWKICLQSWENGKLFTKLNLSKAYQQVRLDDESK